MKCPNCEKQNKPGVKNCEYCNKIMPVRKKKTIPKKEETKDKLKNEPIIELSEEKKAIKKLIKKIKKINKMIYVYIFLVISIIILILMYNNKLHTITCKVNNNSETEKYNIKLTIKRNKDDITGFKYVTHSTTNSYDETLESRYKIIIEELKKKDDYSEIVKSRLNNRSWEIKYTFNSDYLDKTYEYIGIDLSPYMNDVESLVEVLEKEVGFSCK